MRRVIWSLIPVSMFAASLTACGNTTSAAPSSTKSSQPTAPAAERKVTYNETVATAEKADNSWLVTTEKSKWKLSYSTEQEIQAGSPLEITRSVKDDGSYLDDRAVIRTSGQIYMGWEQK